MHNPLTDWHQERIALNEASFRLINERLEHDLVSLTAPDAPQSFICECGSRQCDDTVTITLAEYEHVRERPDRFAVCPGHVFPDAERMVERHAHYWVVEKVGLAGVVAGLTDPR